MKKRLQDSHGFSLVELIIVVSIMTVLICLLAPTYLKYVEKARIQKALTNTQTVADAITVLVTSAETLEPDDQQAFDDLMASAVNGVATIELDDPTDTVALLIQKQVSGGEVSGTVNFSRTEDGYISFTYMLKDGRYEVDYRTALRGEGEGTLVKSDGLFNVYLAN